MWTIIARLVIGNTHGPKLATDDAGRYCSTCHCVSPRDSVIKISLRTSSLFLDFDASPVLGRGGQFPIRSAQQWAELMEEQPWAGAVLRDRVQTLIMVRWLEPRKSVPLQARG